MATQWLLTRVGRSLLPVAFSAARVGKYVQISVSGHSFAERCASPWSRAPFVADVLRTSGRPLKRSDAMLTWRP